MSEVVDLERELATVTARWSPKETAHTGNVVTEHTKTIDQQLGKA